VSQQNSTHLLPTHISLSKWLFLLKDCLWLPHQRRECSSTLNRCNKDIHFSSPAQALPASIAEISINHANLTPVIEWLENSYLTSDSQPATQLARENEVWSLLLRAFSSASQLCSSQAKMYLTDALGAVVENINVIASELLPSVSSLSLTL
jgi:hypothetical protein